MRPTSVITTDTAAAKIGRSMKKCESLTRGYGLLPRAGSDSVLVSPRETPDGKRRDSALGHGDLAAGARALHAADDHAILRREPFADHPQPFDEAPRRHDLLAHGALGIDGVDHLARLVGHDGLVRQHECVEWLRGEQPHLAEHAGREEAVGIRDHRAAADGSRTAVERVVEEVDAAFPAVFGFVLQPDLYFTGVRVAAFTAVLEQGGFRRIEQEADRIFGDDGREHRGVRAHDVAGCQATVRSSTRQRCGDAREREVELLRLHLGFRRREIGGGLQLGCGAQLGLGHTDELRGDHGLRTLQVPHRHWRAARGRRPVAHAPARAAPHTVADR